MDIARTGHVALLEKLLGDGCLVHRRELFKRLTLSRLPTRQKAPARWPRRRLSVRRVDEDPALEEGHGVSPDV